MLGAGSKVVATQKVHTNGNVQTTSNSLDMMIEGDGFFQILMPDGNIAYSRNGQFTLDDEGAIVTSGAGYRLQPEIIIPEDAISITIGNDGEVSVRVRGQQDNQVLGQITTVDFINPGGLEPVDKTFTYQPEPVVSHKKGFRAWMVWGYSPIYARNLERECDGRVGQHD